MVPNRKNTGPQPVLLLPGDRFFVRTIALAEDTSVEDQVILALEGLSPFGPAQLYYGYVTAPDRKSALAYAAYRRRFTADETATWEQTGSVLPEFLPLLASRPKRDGVVLHKALRASLAWPGATARRSRPCFSSANASGPINKNLPRSCVPAPDSPPMPRSRSCKAR